MLQYALQRIAWLIPTLLAMALVTFIIMHATPGSPLDPQAPNANPLNPELQRNLAEKYGLDSTKKRVAEIDAASLNARSRAVFDPPRREFLRKYFDVPLDNVTKFFEWRRYLYLNVLGWEPEPVSIRTWPESVPVPMAA